MVKLSMLGLPLNKCPTKCSNFELFHQEILNLKGIFKRNGYCCNFIDVCIKRFLNNTFTNKKGMYLHLKRN